MLLEQEGDMIHASTAPRSIFHVSLLVAGFEFKCHRGWKVWAREEAWGRGGGELFSQQLRWDLSHHLLYGGDFGGT